MNARHLIAPIALILVLLSACGSLDRTEKIACETDFDCVEGQCVAGQCVLPVIDTTSNNDDSPVKMDGSGPGGEEVPGARDAILESIATSCSADSECADGLHCIDQRCVCCEFILENTNGDGYRCQEEVTPSQLDECVPRTSQPATSEFEALGTDCSGRNDCAGDLYCVGDAVCPGGGTFQGCDGGVQFEQRCMCCVRIASTDEPFPGAFDCSDDPAFYRANCE